MKTLSMIIALAALATLTGCAEAQSSPPEAVDGMALVQKVALAYQDAPALSDTMTVTVKSVRGTVKDDASVLLGPGAAQVQMDGYVITAANGQLYVQRTDSPNKFYARALGENIVTGYAALTNGATIPAPQAALRYAIHDQEQLDAFGMSRASGVRLESTGQVQRLGNTVYEMKLTGGGGARITAWIDPMRFLIREIEVKLPDLAVTANMSPETLDELPRSLLPDEGSLRRVASIGQLNQLGAGDPAPDFSLQTLDGDTIKLSELRGEMVVLDFWATWCGPCKMGLPKLEEVHRWALDVGVPLRVLPVDMGERYPTDEQKKKVVGQYWRSQKFTMPTLMDLDSSVARAYRVGSIPHTVVVGPDGVIMDVKIGFQRGHAAVIKEMARKEFRGAPG